jgi:hypothetical protein
MKKQYQRPALIAERFTLDEFFAATTCTYQANHDYTACKFFDERAGLELFAGSNCADSYMFSNFGLAAIPENVAALNMDCYNTFTAFTEGTMFTS